MSEPEPEKKPPVSVRIDEVGESASKSFWDRVKEHGLAAVLLVAVLSVAGKLLLSNDQFLKEKLIDVIEDGNAINEKRIAADTTQVEVDRLQASAIQRFAEEMDDITDTQRDTNKELARIMRSAETSDSIEAHQLEIDERLKEGSRAKP